MSWQAYVDTNLVGSGHIAKAAIVPIGGGAPWAVTKGFNVTVPETQILSKSYSDPSGIRASGLNIAGERYIVLNADHKSIYGKKGAGGVITAKTGKCILIGVYTDKSTPGNAANTVEKLADYLVENGY
eukprot:TRINITY_DN360_c0_g1_i10.p1 TRINITY_DN360_c0_g1~~TRINITY_DN360_c0_g1_i10.p1  ORF type:complete len:140 (-),score=35.05 TRINITY_DN360_c0_g1_i10:54-437(-)